MDYLFIAAGVAGTILQVVVIYFMTKGFYKAYPAVFFYLLVLFLTTVSDAAAYFDVDAYGTWYSNIFYINNTLRYFSGFAAVMSLYLKVTAVDASMQRVRLRVIVGATIVVLFIFSGHLLGNEGVGSYLAVVGRDVSFFTAVLILLLWMMLIRYRTKDPFLFLISSGLGLNMSGDAIALSLLHLQAPAALASAIAIGAHILCLLIWIKALRQKDWTSQATSRLTSA